MRRPDRGHHLSGALGGTAPVAGGRDLALPGGSIRLAATRWTGARGAPVVLLHGLASQRRFWNLVVPHLVGAPLCVLDARGHGDSDKPDDGYDLATVAADVATALDALGWSRAVVVGHSWGGAVAATLAADHPERVLSVVLLDGGHSRPLPHLPVAEARERLAPPGTEEEPARLAELLAGWHKGYWSPAVRDAVLPIYEVHPDGLARPRLTTERHWAILDALLAYDAADVLPRIAAPAWVGTAALTEGYGSAIGLLRRPRGFALHGAVHDVPLQWPALVAGVVRAAADEVATEGRE